MEHPIKRLYEFLDRPIFPVARALLALLVVPLALSLTVPLWRITLEAPQYPDGLYVDIYAYTIVGGDDGRHLAEINTLNHYIGMAKINRAAISDFDWMPFALGFLGVLALRTAVLGKVSTLVDMCVGTFYLFAFTAGRFYYKLYAYGHNLSPDAPIDVAPFTPSPFGKQQIANFTTYAYPRIGTLFLVVFAGGLVALLVWHLVKGRREAVRSEAAK
jgi:copper chaperone NosL